MPVVTKGEVTQDPSGSPLTFTDQTTGLGTIISRNLSIYDGNGNLLATINMGGSISTDLDITADGYFSFIEVIVDNTGTYTALVNYLSTAFYEITYAPLANKLDCCGNEEKCINLYKGEICKSDAILFFERGVAELAQSNIEAANLFLTEADCGC